MDKDQENRIARFVNDRGMSETIYQCLLESFMNPVQKDSSVEEKAAEWLSIQKLNKAFKDLRNYQSNEDSESSVRTQIGV